ncbi:MAG TPA: DinB family protein, partial [Capsulimonadaceae bacterium]|nr:DinB family protein [Capsulimonadaceae bacterium]
MEQPAHLAIQEANQLNDRLLRNLAKTPDDRLNWSPAPTARTPLQLVAHCAFSLGFITTMLNGTPYPAKTMAQADAEFLEMEREVTTREQALALWESRFNQYVSFLSSLQPDQMDTMVKLPFEMGELPM